MLWPLEDENINARIWDFAGHTVTHAVHQFFLSERCLYIVVYDGRTEQRNRLAYWLNHMKNYGGNSSAIILVNEQDQHTVDIQINNLKEKYSIAGVYSFSIKNDTEALESFRDEVAVYIGNNPSWNKQLIPKNYFQVKSDLEALFSKENNDSGKEHISKKEFEAIARAHDVDDIDQLLIDLHALGVSLWYQGMEEFDTLVLNPEWISHGVYQIINWVNDKKVHALSLSEFANVFADDAERFPGCHHQFLFNLMKHYELAYETKNAACLIIPHLLHEDRPERLPDFPVGESLMLKYKAEQPLPPHTISRFIVRHNQEIRAQKHDHLVWRYGVVLEDGNGSVALIREDDRTISVSVKGQDKTHYISRLRETLNDIFNSYKSEKPELLYRVERYGMVADNLDEKHPLWLPDSKILNHATDHKLYYEDISKQDIDLNRTANQYNISANNVILGGHGHTLTEDKSTHFNFHHCNIGLQGGLNELAQYLTEAGSKEAATELENAAKALEQAEQCTSQEDIKKKGIAKRLTRLVADLGDKNSSLHKSVEGIKHGVGIAQDIGKGYNDLAQWVGLPQIPTPFLKKE